MYEFIDAEPEEDKGEASGERPACSSGGIHDRQCTPVSCKELLNNPSFLMLQYNRSKVKWLNG